jgi:hypothetical protein
MFSQVIAQVRTLGTAVQRMSVPPGAAEEVRAAVMRFLDEGPPLMESSRAQAVAFADTSETVLQRMAQALQRGSQAAAVLPDLRGLGVQATQTRDQLSTRAQPVTQFRDRLNQDSAKLNSQSVELRARLAGLAAQHERLSQQAAELTTRLNIINGVSVVFPIVKLADTIVSLIQSKTTTEGQLTEVNQQYAQAQGQANQLEGFIQQIAALGTSVQQLAGGAQNLLNMVNIIAGQMGNESAFAGAATADSAKLFVTALQRLVETMKQDAS